MLAAPRASVAVNVILYTRPLPSPSSRRGVRVFTQGLHRPQRLTYPDGHDVPKTIRTLTRNVTVRANVGFYRRRANRDTVAAASGTPSANAEKK